MGQVLGVVYRFIATYLINKAGLGHKRAHSGAVTLIQRFGTACSWTGCMSSAPMGQCGLAG